MSDEKPVKYVIRDRLRLMGIVYAVATALALIVAIWAQSTAAIIGVAIATVGVVIFFISTERNARRDN